MTEGHNRCQDRDRETTGPREGGGGQDKGYLGAVVQFYEMRTAGAHMAAPVSMGSRGHREHALVPKSHRM